MDLYLQQFKNLPRELRQAVSSEEKVKQLEQIEAKYNLKLTKLVVRVMIKDISWVELEKFCQENFNLSGERARELKKDLTEKIFNEVLAYLNKPSYKSTKDKEEKEKTEDQTIQKSLEFGVSKQENIQKEEIKPELNFKKVRDDFKRIKPSLNQSLNEEDFIKKLIQELGLNLGDQNLTKRFTNLIKSYLKDIRTEGQMEEALKRSVKTGGLEINSEQAALIVRSALDFKNKLTGSSKSYFVEREGAKENLRLKVEDLNGKEEDLKSKVSVSGQIKKEEILFDNEIQKRFKGGAINPTFQKLEKPLLISSPQVEIKATRDNEKKESFKITDTVPLNIKKINADEDLMKDVQAEKPKAIGPVEELAEITLEDLIRWGGGENTSQIVLDKINLLAEISLLKKSEAIRAWQTSPLYKLYLSLGNEALVNNKSIIEIIENKKKLNEKTLNFEDFEAIIELNQKLRF